MRRTLPLLIFSTFACSQTPAPEDLSFPRTFLFGTAVAGFQVDMGCPTLGPVQCDDPASDWYDWITNPKLLADSGTYLAGDPPSAGPGFLELYDQDINRAATELHSNALRLSIEWSRIFPSATDGVEDFASLKAMASQSNLAYYHALFASLKAHGMKPLVTLDHYTLPSWIHDAYGCHTALATCTNRGWLDHDRIIHEMSKYAGFVAQEFGGEVDLWATLNEPFIAIVVAGYLLPTAQRTNPPGVSLQFDAAKQVFANEVEAHARMYDAVKAADKMDADGDGVNAQVGLVFNIQAVVPDDPENPDDVRGAQHLSYFMNQMFLDGTIKGDLDTQWDGQPTHRDDLAGRMDFLGVNYYAQLAVQGTPKSLFPQVSPLLDVNLLSLQYNWAYPKGIDEVLTWAWQNYKVPLYISETGVEDAMDSGKAGPWVVQTLTWVKRAISAGVDVRGYFYWTLMDNYEWNHGMSVHMGLYGVDKSDPMKTRKARQAVAVYGRIAQLGEVPPDLAMQFPAN
jgi:beta-glucosidase/6-phospho-beta-glucosidase/beta-galactosidase